jgi:hypothetical protein
MDTGVLAAVHHGGGRESGIGQVRCPGAFVRLGSAAQLAWTI